MGEEMRDLMISARGVVDEALVGLDPAVRAEILGAVSQGGRLRLELDFGSIDGKAPPCLLVSLWTADGNRREICEVIAFNGMRQ